MIGQSTAVSPVFIAISGIIICLGIPRMAASSLPDVSFRINQNVNAALNNDISVHAWMFQHMNQNMSEFQYFETGIGPRFRPDLSWLAFCLLYRQSFSKQSESSWAIEKSPSANVELAFRVWKLKLWSQTRFEYRITHHWHNLRVKNFFKLSLGRQDTTPYVAWESFYENRSKEIGLHRYFMGISASISEAIATIYYIRFDVKRETRWRLYRVCVGFKLVFNYETRKAPLK